MYLSRFAENCEEILRKIAKYYFGVRTKSSKYFQRKSYQSCTVLLVINSSFLSIPMRGLGFLGRLGRLGWRLPDPSRSSHRPAEAWTLVRIANIREANSRIGLKDGSPRQCSEMRTSIVVEPILYTRVSRCSGTGALGEN